MPLQGAMFARIRHVILIAFLISFQSSQALHQSGVSQLAAGHCRPVAAGPNLSIEEVLLRAHLYVRFLFSFLADSKYLPTFQVLVAWLCI
jgi:hypothetical protein